ncbi:MAG: hypothetical protein ACPGXL_02780 [Chitinophagales bacterium]
MAVKIFIGYDSSSKQDSRLKDAFIRHLHVFERRKLIEIKDISHVKIGSDTAKELTYLTESQVAIFLYSSDFLVLDKQPKMETMVLKKLDSDPHFRFIPVLLRPCLLMPEIEALKIVPDKEDAVTNEERWQNEDEAFIIVVQEIARVLKSLQKPLTTKPKPQKANQTSNKAQNIEPDKHTPKQIQQPKRSIQIQNNASKEDVLAVLHVKTHFSPDGDFNENGNLVNENATHKLKLIERFLQQIQQGATQIQAGELVINKNALLIRKAVLKYYENLEEALEKSEASAEKGFWAAITQGFDTIMDSVSKAKEVKGLLDEVLQNDPNNVEAMLEKAYVLMLATPMNAQDELALAYKVDEILCEKNANTSMELFIKAQVLLIIAHADDTIDKAEKMDLLQEALATFKQFNKPYYVQECEKMLKKLQQGKWTTVFLDGMQQGLEQTEKNVPVTTPSFNPIGNWKVQATVAQPNTMLVQLESSGTLKGNYIDTWGGTRPMNGKWGFEKKVLYLQEYLNFQIYALNIQIQQYQNGIWYGWGSDGHQYGLQAG